MADLDAAFLELDMDNYDGQEDGLKGVFGTGNPGMAYYRSNLEDPYITLADPEAVESEGEDYEIRGSDFVLLTAKNEDEVSHLEVRLK